MSCFLFYVAVSVLLSVCFLFLDFVFEDDVEQNEDLPIEKTVGDPIAEALVFAESVTVGILQVRMILWRIWILRQWRVRRKVTRILGRTI